MLSYHGSFVDANSPQQVKHLLLKVIQDYHPDKVADDHGEQWKLVSEEISKRLNKYFGELK